MVIHVGYPGKVWACLFILRKVKVHPGKVVSGPRPEEGYPGKLLTGITCRYISYPTYVSCRHHNDEPS